MDLLLNLVMVGSLFSTGYVLYPTDKHTDTEKRFYWYTMILITLVIFTVLTVGRINYLYLIGIYLFGLGMVGYYLRFVLHPVNIRLSLLNNKNVERIPSVLYRVPDGNTSSVVSMFSFDLIKLYTITLSFFILLLIYAYFKTQPELPKRKYLQMNYYDR